ncbi:MAG: hypothetical protein Q4A79_01010 [Candidatus Saccharibacteria bacterium]|nr:hypothetical protein [Candidatus Saccharibacteria bacterium]
MNYFHPILEPTGKDLFWNIPERKSGTAGIIGGNSQNFRTSVRVAEFLTKTYSLERVNLILPDVLRGKLPPLDNLYFLSSTESGSFKDGEELKERLNSSDFSLLIGDFSKNSITSRAVATACVSSEKPAILTRDTVDLLTENQPERALMNKNLIIFSSGIQLQKLLRAVYYPKTILLSQSIVQIADTIHKFTISYPISIITIHNGQLLIAKGGEVSSIELAKTGFSPLSVWSGELAAKILALNLYNPNNFIAATIAASFRD